MPQDVQIKNDQLPVIALVGRVNVGKSTLFNRLTETTKALVSKVPGTTRTSNEGVILWRGKEIKIIDTGGLTFTDDVALEEDILKQSEAALKIADIILFVTNAKDGVLHQERELAKRLRRVQNKPVLLIANKADNKQAMQNLTDPEWYKLGLGEPIPVAAASGKRTGDLLDHIYTMLETLPIQPKDTKQQKTDTIRVSIMGKPNVGKSSLFNRIIGFDRVIVSDMEHTTREPFDTEVLYEYEVGDKTETQSITFVDTAGIRRKANVDGQLEKQGITKSLESVDASDIVLFVIDGSQPISHQDRQLGGLLERRAKSVIIVLNKWDLAEDTSDAHRNEVKELVYANFPHLDFAPIVFTSGKTGYRTHNLYPEIMKIWRARHTEVPNKTVELFIKRVTRTHLPSRGKGTRQPMVLGMEQVATAPPVFEIVVKYRTSLHTSYIHYLENKLREQFDFYGTPVIIRLKKQKR